MHLSTFLFIVYSTDFNSPNPHPSIHPSIHPPTHQYDKALFLRIDALQPAERLNALINANWRLPKTPKALQNLLQNPKEGDFWQADHIKAVAEGGGGCGLDNLRTLCTPCHQVETERLRGRLKLMDNTSSNSGGAKNSNAKKTDIRTLFAKQKKQQEKPMQKQKPSAD